MLKRSAFSGTTVSAQAKERLHRRHQQHEVSQLLGRSRAERLMDGFYVRQRSALKRRQPAESKKKANVSFTKVTLLPPSKRRRTQETQYSEKPPETKPETTPPPTRTLDAGLRTLARTCHYRGKYPKVVKTFLKLCQSEHLTVSNRELFLEVAYLLATSDHCLTAGDARQDLMHLFEKVLVPRSVPPVTAGDAGSLLSEYIFTHSERFFLEILAIAAVHSNRLFTDDSYVFNREITFFKEQLEQIETYGRQEETAAAEAGPPKTRASPEEMPVSEMPVSPADARVESDGGEMPEETPAAAAGGSDGIPATGASQEVKVEESEAPPEVKSEDEKKEQVRWQLPPRSVLENLRRMLFIEGLNIIFDFRLVSWAKPSVADLFQQVYLRRHLFSEYDQEQIARWQAAVKAGKVSDFGSAPHVGTMGEAANPVTDGREERVSFEHGSVTWAAKQTGM